MKQISESMNNFWSLLISITVFLKEIVNFTKKVYFMQTAELRILKNLK